jgi:ElaB/YqjD/DUF883 family membrane-anchored ribosome-binding protein
MYAPFNVPREKLAEGFRAVLADAEELVKATASETGERVRLVRSRLEHSLQAARERFAELEELALERSRAAARATDRFAHDNPWQTAGVAAGIGLLLGLLIGRKL